MDSEASHEADTRENKVFAVFICATVNIWIVKTLVYVWVCVCVCVCVYVYGPCSRWDQSSPTKDQICVPCSESMES